MRHLPRDIGSQKTMKRKESGKLGSKKFNGVLNFVGDL